MVFNLPGKRYNEEIFHQDFGGKYWLDSSSVDLLFPSYLKGKCIIVIQYNMAAGGSLAVGSYYSVKKAGVEINLKGLG